MAIPRNSGNRCESLVYSNTQQFGCRLNLAKSWNKQAQIMLNQIIRQETKGKMMGNTNFTFLSEQAEDILRYAIDNAKDNLVYFGGFRDHMLFLAFKEELEINGYLKKYPAHVLSGSSHILTSSGRDYFVDKATYQHKEAQKMFIKLSGEARTLLQKMLENRHRLGEYLNNDLCNSSSRDSSIEYLKSKGIFKEAIYDVTGCWHVELNYSGLHYFELEEEYLAQQVQSQSNHFNVNGTNVVIQTGNNNNAFISNNDELSKVVDRIKALLPDDISEEDKEIIIDSTETIQAELQNNKPKKGLIRTAINGLHNILPKMSGSIELTAAILSIIEFASKIQ